MADGIGARYGPSTVLRSLPIFALASLTGCATLPQAPVQRALYIDARQIVETEERLGWQIDSSEIEDVTPAMLQSVCQVSEVERIKLLDWLDQRIEEEGGSAEKVWRENDKSLSAAKTLLTLERIRDALEHADQVAEEDCPFWLEEDPDFDGLQADTNRFLILGESFGGLMLLIRDGGVAVGGGGSLRLLPGYGFGHLVTVALGIEVGGTGALTQNEEGSQELSARPAGGIPLVVRFHDDTWVYDVEVAALTQYYREEILLPPGFRVAGAVGLTSVRIGDFMPIASGFLAYEYYPSFLDLPEQHGIRIGTKVGINYDP